jgi:hypothetical protein
MTRFRPECKSPLSFIFLVSNSHPETEWPSETCHLSCLGGYIGHILAYKTFNDLTSS